MVRCNYVKVGLIAVALIAIRVTSAIALDYERDESYSLQPLVIERIGINFMGIDAKDRLFLGAQLPTTLDGETEYLVTLNSEGNLTPFSQNALAAIDEIGFSVPRFFDLGLEGWLLSLIEQNVTNPLLQTSLHAFEGSQAIAFSEADHSDPDVQAATNRLGAFQLEVSSLDTAFYMTQDAGVYGTHSATDPENFGISLIELYLDYVSDNLVLSLRYRNFSGRGYASQDEGALIGGFMIDGNSPKTVLIRGIGPRLVEQEVTNFLSDPVISLYQNGQLIAQNDNWSDAEIESEANRIGAFALKQNSNDAGLIVTLEPGIYGAIMTSGNPDEQGIGLLEIYDLDD